MDISKNYYLKNFLKGGFLGPVTVGIAAIGKAMSANPKFRPSYYENVYITYVWVSLKKLIAANHWAVVFKLSNGKYGITQFDTTGGIELIDDFNSLEAASRATWGKSDHVRLSCYGSCKKNYNNFVSDLCCEHTYIFGFNDCQNYAREIVKILTGRTVGVWPIEDGPDFGQRTIPNLGQIADAAGPAVVLCAINPMYWLARAFAG